MAEFPWMVTILTNLSDRHQLKTRFLIDLGNFVLKNIKDRQIAVLFLNGKYAVLAFLDYFSAPDFFHLDYLQN